MPLGGAAFGNELGENSAPLSTLRDDVIGPFEGSIDAVAAPNIDHAEPGDEGHPVVAAFGEFSGERVCGGVRAHHDTCGEAGSGRGGPGSGEADASGALVEAGVDGELTELFAFGVRAVHK